MVLTSGFVGSPQTFSNSTQHQEVASSHFSNFVQSFSIPLPVELKRLPPDGLRNCFQRRVHRLKVGQTVTIQNAVVHIRQITVEVFGDGEGVLKLLKCHNEEQSTRLSENVKRLFILFAILQRLFSLAFVYD